LVAKTTTSFSVENKELRRTLAPSFVVADSELGGLRLQPEYGRSTK